MHAQFFQEQFNFKTLDPVNQKGHLIMAHLLMTPTAQVPQMPFNHQTNALRENGAPDSFGTFDLVEDIMESPARGRRYGKWRES